MSDTSDKLRVIPSDWMGPLNLVNIFGRQPVALEVDLGCGPGRFLLARAARYPKIAFLGLDRLLLRVQRVEREARRRRLSNIRLIYVEIYYAVSYLLPAESVSVYYIFFPDPWPKRRHRRRRLFDQGFLDALNKTLLPTGSIHIATDHQDYFQIIQQTFNEDARFATTALLQLKEDERSDFECQFIGQHKPIYRCAFMKAPQ